MKLLCWSLIVIAAVATLLGGILHLANRTLFSPPYGYGVVAVVLLLFAVAIGAVGDRK
jgi:hypothetical protein